MILKMAAAAIILDFQKFEISTAFPLSGAYASPCQISAESVKRLQRYGYLTVFKMAAVRHLGFLKLPRNRGFVISKTAAVGVLDLKKIRVSDM